MRTKNKSFSHPEGRNGVEGLALWVNCFILFSSLGWDRITISMPGQARSNPKNLQGLGGHWTGGNWPPFSAAVNFLACLVGTSSVFQMVGFERIRLPATCGNVLPLTSDPPISHPFL